LGYEKELYCGACNFEKKSGKDPQNESLQGRITEVDRFNHDGK
jgi:hypothetical protein